LKTEQENASEDVTVTTTPTTTTATTAMDIDEEIKTEEIKTTKRALIRKSKFPQPPE